MRDAEGAGSVVACLHFDLSVVAGHVYLFGSKAGGQATPDSDHDLLVVVPKSDKPRYRRDQEAYLALCGSGAAKDIIVFNAGGVRVLPSSCLVVDLSGSERGDPSA